MVESVVKTQQEIEEERSKELKRKNYEHVLKSSQPMWLAQFMVKHYCWINVIVAIIFIVCAVLTFSMGLISLTPI